MWVNRTERSLCLFVIFILSVYQHVRSELTEKDNHNKPLEKLNEKDITNTYSSLKANEFLTYDKCMQRMKCPASRKEECSEECQAGNTEEEVEEHQELTINEYRSAMKNKPLDTDKQTIKTDL